MSGVMRISPLRISLRLFVNGQAFSEPPRHAKIRRISKMNTWLISWRNVLKPNRNSPAGLAEGLSIGDDLAKRDA